MDNNLKRIEELLELLILSTKKVYTIDDVAKVTGFKKSYIYRLISDGELESYKPTNGQSFIDREDLEVWMLTNKQEVKK